MVKMVLEKYFPGALNGKLVESLIFNALSDLGFNGENTLFGDSSCPDEVNHDDPAEDITSLFR